MKLFVVLILFFVDVLRVSPFNISILPTKAHLREGIAGVVNITLEFEHDDFNCDEYDVHFHIKDDNLNITSSGLSEFNRSCIIQAIMTSRHMGRMSLPISVISANVSHMTQYDVVILRSVANSKLANIFTGCTAVLLVIISVSMGTQLDANLIVQHVKHLSALLTGLACQLLLMPLIAFGWGRLLLSDSLLFWYSYFAIGCAPGGGLSNMWTILMDGNLDLSAVMTFSSNMLALGNIPLWLYTIGKFVILKDEGDVGVPFSNIALGLTFIIIPSVIGLLVRWKLPKVANFVTTVIKTVLLVLIIAIIVFGIYSNQFVFYLLTWKIVLAGMLLPWTGFALGFVVSLLFRNNWVDARTIGIETGIQNIKLAMVILQISFASPESDLALVIPFSCFLLAPIPFVPILVWHTIQKRRAKKYQNVKKNVDVTELVE